MKRIIHIISGLGSGGAENMLYKLLKYSDRNKYYHEVISLNDKGLYGESIEKLGIKVHSLNLKSRSIILSLLKTRTICKTFDLVDTWLYHADLFGFLLAKVLLRKKIIWNIRHCNLDRYANGLMIQKLIKVNSFLSGFVDFITYNSVKALKNHVIAGYRNNNYIVIPNGFELDKFKYDDKSRNHIRKELGLGEEKVFITVGTWNIQKDYYTLLRSLNELKKHNSEFKMIMVGLGLDYSNIELINLVKKYNLESEMVLLGRREDIPALLSAADIYVSSSLGESFSNSIGEAMACELACVVTDVGDSKQIVADTGMVVRAKDYIDMSSILLSYTEKICIERNRKARIRVIANYEIGSIARRFEENYAKVLL